MAGPGKSLVKLKRYVLPPGPGRPSSYTPELAQRICQRIAEGETLLEICRDADMPASSTVRGWEFDDRQGKPTVAKGFSALYARAVEMRTEYELDLLRELSSKPSIGRVVTIKEVITKDGDIVKVREARLEDRTARSALAVDALKWRIAKMQPHKYNRKPVDDAPDQSEGQEPNRLIIEGGLPDDEPAPPAPEGSGE